MTRRLLNLMNALSLLLCVAACVLWARSYWRDDIVGISLERGTRAAFSHGGALGVDWWITGGVNNFALNDPFYHVIRRSPTRDDIPRSALPRMAELRTPNMRPSAPPLMRRITVPFWMVVAGTAVLPIRSAVRRRRSIRRSVLGICQSCGYDLRASPGRCPECGPAGASPARD
jgi:hypothetical protein